MNTQTLRPLSTSSLITMCLPLGALNLFVMTVIINAVPEFIVIICDQMWMTIT